jgi:hypothetical protein
MKIGVIYLSENGLKSVTKSVTKFAVFRKRDFCDIAKSIFLLKNGLKTAKIAKKCDKCDKIKTVCHTFVTPKKSKKARNCVVFFFV